MRVSTFTAVTASFVLLCGAARAGEPNEADAAFRRGIALMESGSITEACAAFEQSERLESKAGTLLNLAGCYERASRWADAYRTFEQARDGARARQRPDWEAVATEHMATLKPKVAFVTVDAFSVSGPPGARVTIDGRPVTEEELRRGAAVAPGTHAVRREAAGYRSSEQTITTPPDARVTLAPLEREPAAREAMPVEGPLAQEDPPARKTVGIVVASTGVAALAFGAFGALVASNALADAKEACSSYPDHCTPDAADPNERAETWSTLGTAGLVGGAALLAVGLALYLWPVSRGATTSTTSSIRREGPTQRILTGNGRGLSLAF